MKQIKVVQIGCGKMSKYIMKYIYDLGGEIVGAVDVNEMLIGQDISAVMECEDKHIIINDVSKLDEILKEMKPDIAVITTCSLLNDLEESIRTCVVNKVNVITTCEECFYASNSNPSLFHELDVLAKTYGVTITGCGYQDVFWGNMVSVVAASSHNITKIKGSSSYNVEDYGIALAKAHGAGLTLEEFESEVASSDNISKEQRDKLIEERKFAPCYMWNNVGWLADKLGLTPTNLSQKCVPITAEEDIHSDTLNMDITKGMCTGMRAIATLETKEGIEIEAECIGKVYNENDFDKNEWTIIGEPETTFTVNKPDTVRLTCADIVNRIHDVIASPSGFMATSEIGEATYKLNFD